MVPSAKAAAEQAAASEAAADHQTADTLEHTHSTAAGLSMAESAKANVRGKARTDSTDSTPDTSLPHDDHQLQRHATHQGSTARTLGRESPLEGTPRRALRSLLCARRLTRKISCLLPLLEPQCMARGPREALLVRRPGRTPATTPLTPARLVSDRLVSQGYPLTNSQGGDSDYQW